MPALSIRKIDDDVLARFNSAAKARGWTQGKYLAQLVALHDAMRALADNEEMDAFCKVAPELEALGLETVRR